MSEDGKFNCKGVGNLTDIYGLATSMGISLLTKTGKSKEKRTLCTEINQMKKGGYEAWGNTVAEGQKPFYDEDSKETLIMLAYNFFVDPELQRAINYLYVDHTEGEPFNHNGVEVIRTYWKGFLEYPTIEPTANILKECGTIKVLNKTDEARQQQEQRQKDEAEKRQIEAERKRAEEAQAAEKKRIEDEKQRQEDERKQQEIQRLENEKKKQVEEAEQRREKAEAEERRKKEEQRIQEEASVIYNEKVEEESVVGIANVHNIPLVTPSLVELNHLSEYFKKDLKSYYKFRGQYAYTWGWLLYLQNLLGKDVICVAKGSFTFTPSFEFLSNRFGKKKSKPVTLQTFPRMNENIRFEAIGEVDESLNRCFKDGARFSVVLLYIKIEPTVSHANAMIFDRQYKRLTRFEPHGSEVSIYDSNDLDQQIQSWLKMNRKDWSYNAPSMYCPAFGPQNLEARAIIKESNAFRGVKSEEQGFCVVWSWLFIHLRVVNPTASDEEIVKSLTMQTPNELALKVRKYTEFITNIIDPDAEFKVGDFVLLSKKICTQDLEHNTKRTCYGKIVKVSPKTLQIQTTSYQIKLNMVRADAGLIRLVTDESVKNLIQQKILSQKQYQVGDIVLFNGKITGEVLELKEKDDYQVYIRTTDVRHPHIIANPMDLQPVTDEKKRNEIRLALKDVPLEPKAMFLGEGGWRVLHMNHLPDVNF